MVGGLFCDFKPTRCTASFQTAQTPDSLIARITIDETGMWDAAMSNSAGVEAAGWAWRFAVEGVTAISPIVQSVEIVNFDGGGFERKIDPLDEVFWSRWCQPMLSASGAVVIPAMDGWDSSHGVWRETRFALLTNRPVFLIAADPEVAP